MVLELLEPQDRTVETVQMELTEFPELTETTETTLPMRCRLLPNSASTVLRHPPDHQDLPEKRYELISHKLSNCCVDYLLAI